MPTCGGYYYGFWQANPRRWDRCCRDAAAQMIAEGWNKYARKFSEVHRKRALKLWNA